MPNDWVHPFTIAFPSKWLCQGHAPGRVKLHACKPPPDSWLEEPVRRDQKKKRRWHVSQHTCCSESATCSTGRKGESRAIGVPPPGDCSRSCDKAKEVAAPFTELGKPGQLDLGDSSVYWCIAAPRKNPKRGLLYLRAVIS